MLDLLNQLGTPAWNLARAMFLQTTLLAAALVVFDLFIGRRLRSALRYALWLLLVVKLLLPPSLLLPTGAGFWLGRWLTQPVVVPPPAQYQVTAEEVDPTLEIAWSQPVETLTAPPAVLSLHAKLLLAWAAGALLLGLGMMVRNRPVSRLARCAEDAPADLQAVLREAAESVGLRRVPALRLSEANHSPAVCGFFRPVILLPRELAGRLAPDGLRAVLVHELMHLRRHDLWVNLLQAVVQVLWWWNPLVWLANARIRTLREQAVDEGVMLATQQDRATYPATLVEVARHCAARPMLALSFLGIFESRRALRSRVNRLLHAPLPRRASLGWTGWLTLLVTALVALPMAFNRRVEAAPADEPTVITRLNWQPWSEAAVAEARAAGRPVLVDFTADWCVTCQANRAILERTEVMQELQSLNALVLEADFTKSNAVIAAKLAEFGQPGVPLVLFYPADPAQPPKTYTVLPPKPLELESPQPAAPPAAASTNPPASAYRMSPELARRYGLIPSQTNAQNFAPTNRVQMDPALAARYGLNQGGVASNSPASAYPLDPELARRYGLIPGPSHGTTNASSPTGAGMSPALAARYGLIPAGGPTNLTGEPIATAPSPYTMNVAPVLGIDIPADNGSSYLVEGKSLTLPELKATLSERLGKEPNLAIVLRSDKAASFSRLQEVVQAAQAIGITRLSLATGGQSPVTPLNLQPPSSASVLLTRQFRVDPNTFIQNLERVTGTPLATVPETNPAIRIQGQVRAFFRAAGVDFSPPPEGGTPDQSSKAVFFSDRTGILFVRATAEDLEIIEKAIQALNVAPPQVQVEVKFVEIEGMDSKALGFDWFLGNALANPSPGTPDAGPVPGGSAGSSGGGVFPQAGGLRAASTNAAPNLTGILTEQQFRTVLAALESRPGVKLLSAPKVTTLTGRQAQISMVNLESIVDADGKTNAVPFGPVLDVIPFVTADGQAIQLTVLAGFTEFLGTDPAAPHLPRLRSSQMQSSAEMWDSQTLVLAGDIVEGTANRTTNQVPTLGDLPVLGRFFRSEKQSTRRRLLVFVTPTIIDPAGRRVHDPARPPFDPNTVPPQRR